MHRIRRGGELRARGSAHAALPAQEPHAGEKTEARPPFCPMLAQRGETAFDQFPGFAGFAVMGSGERQARIIQSCLAVTGRKPVSGRPVQEWGWSMLWSKPR